MAICYDTNILLRIVQDKSNGETIRKIVNPEQKIEFISIVSAAELQSLARQHSWGETKWKNLLALLNDLNVVSIDNSALVEQYVVIDVFSQGKDKLHRLTGSARNMGKNDLWIAATASLLQFELITSDQDFQHLTAFFPVSYIAPEKLTA